MVQVTEVARLMKLSGFESRNLFKKLFTDDIAKKKEISIIPRFRHNYVACGVHTVYTL